MLSVTVSVLSVTVLQCYSVTGLKCYSVIVLQDYSVTVLSVKCYSFCVKCYRVRVL